MAKTKIIQNDEIFGNRLIFTVVPGFRLRVDKFSYLMWCLRLTCLTISP